jgi:hypothetical protein
MGKEFPAREKSMHSQIRSAISEPYCTAPLSAALNPSAVDEVDRHLGSSPRAAARLRPTKEIFGNLSRSSERPFALLRTPQAHKP